MLTETIRVSFTWLQVFGHKVGNITAGQAGNTAGQDETGNRQCGYSNIPARKYIGQVHFISPTHSLSVRESMCIQLVLHLDWRSADQSK